jgi:hypothetical protein
LEPYVEVRVLAPELRPQHIAPSDSATACIKQVKQGGAMSSSDPGQRLRPVVSRDGLFGGYDSHGTHIRLVALNSPNPAPESATHG